MNFKIPIWAFIFILWFGAIKLGEYINPVIHQQVPMLADLTSIVPPVLFYLGYKYFHKRKEVEQS